MNRHSPAEIAGLMTEDHVFIDSLGTRVAGRQHRPVARCGRKNK
ncbi:MAG: hypothetical protein ABSC93_11265 [Bryobacteraceae bacterium]|jgi:hypothetical protein